MTFRLPSTPSIKRTDRRQLTSLVIILATYLLVSWCYFGFAYGPRGFVSGDDYYPIATASLDQFPGCTGVTNWINPWRPLYPISACVFVKIFGLNADGIGSLNFLVYAATAFAWFGIVRNAFRTSTWLAFVIGLIYLSYPDDWARLALVGGIRLVGPMLTLFGFWWVLSFWDRPRAYWRLATGCLLVGLGLFTYETFIGLAVVGLPLALLYKNRGASKRWIAVSLVNGIAPALYALWRFFVLPTTYTSRIIRLGEGEIVIDPVNFLQQLRDSYSLIVLLWQRAFSWLQTYQSLAGPNDVLRIMGVSAFAAVAVGVSMLIVNRVNRHEPLIAVDVGEDLVRAMFYLIPVLALPFYILKLDLVNQTFRSYGTPFAASLGLVGLLLLLTRSRSGQQPGLGRTLDMAVVTVLMATFFAVSSGYGTLDYRRNSSVICDFALRLTDVVERLPQNVYVVGRVPVGQTVPPVLDSYTLSSLEAMLYYEGPQGPESYDYGRMGHTGYLVSFDPTATLIGNKIQVQWSPLAGALHQFSPLPPAPDRNEAILMEYDPLKRLTILSAPQDLDGLVIRADGGSTARAHTRAEEFCG